MEKEILRVENLMDRISLKFFGIELQVHVGYDIIALDAYKTLEKFGFPRTAKEMREPRVFIQMIYEAPDTKSGQVNSWKGAKWYLTEYMTDDEIVKKAYLAFRTCIEHEVLESFKVDGIILFNPHTDFEELLKISHKEVKRS